MIPKAEYTGVEMEEPRLQIERPRGNRSKPASVHAPRLGPS